MADMVFSGVTFSGGYSITLPPPSGTQKAIFGFGQNGSGTNVSITNLVSNTGVVANDTAGVGQARWGLGASTYGSDKAIFAYGSNLSMSNLVSNTGVVSTDSASVGTGRTYVAGAGYSLT